MLRWPNGAIPRRYLLNDDLFIKRIPRVIKELIAREAQQNHRSVNQEALALLEEALLNRVEAQHGRARNALAMLTSYATHGSLNGSVTGSVTGSLNASLPGALPGSLPHASSPSRTVSEGVASHGD